MFNFALEVFCGRSVFEMSSRKFNVYSGQAIANPGGNFGLAELHGNEGFNELRELVAFDAGAHFFHQTKLVKIWVGVCFEHDQYVINNQSLQSCFCNTITSTLSYFKEFVNSTNFQSNITMFNYNNKTLHADSPQ